MCWCLLSANSQAKDCCTVGHRDSLHEAAPSQSQRTMTPTIRNAFVARCQRFCPVQVFPYQCFIFSSWQFRSRTVSMQ